MTDFSAYLIVTDLDGTFLNKKGGVVQRNLDAVARFCAGGGRFTVNTGRTHFTLSPVVPQPHLLLNAPASHCKPTADHGGRGPRLCKAGPALH